MQSRLFLFRSSRFFLLVLLLWGVCGGSSPAAVTPVDSKIIDDSEEPFDRRIYHYDMAVDAKGELHIIYAKPTANNAADIYYVRKVSGAWQSPVLLTTQGFGPNGTTYLAVGSDDLIHACYIKKEPQGTPHTEALYYRTIINGVAGSELFVDGGGWNTRMQLDSTDSPMFIRSMIDWNDPAKPSKLALFTTATHGASWNKAFLNLPQVPQFRLADFVFANGVFHITYGDFAYTRNIWNRAGTIESGIFHNFHYATSANGTAWDVHLVDNSGWLYEMEFWTSLVLVEGRPLIGMYRYDQYNNSYNTGSYSILTEWNGSSWQKKIITDRSRPELTEGMGIGLLAYGNGDFFGAWDFSPVNTYNDDFRGARGNIALARSGSGGDWTSKWQIDPFSLEGKALLRIHGNKLYFLALADHVDAKIFFREYDIQVFNRPPQPSSGVTIAPINMLLLNGKR